MCGGVERDESEQSKFDLSFLTRRNRLEMYSHIILSACLRNVYTRTHTQQKKKMRDKCWPSQKKKKKKKSCFSGRGVIDIGVHYRRRKKKKTKLFLLLFIFICRLAGRPHNAIVYTVTLNNHTRRLYSRWMLCIRPEQLNVQYNIYRDLTVLSVLEWIEKL